MFEEVLSSSQRITDSLGQNVAATNLIRGCVITYTFDITVGCGLILYVLLNDARKLQLISLKIEI